MQFMKHLVMVATLATVLPAQAAVQSFALSGAFESGHFSGATYQGQLSFDDAALSLTGLEFVSLNSLQFQLLGTTYDLSTPALQTASAVYQDGVFTGVEWAFDTAVNGGTLGFSIIPGSLDTTDTFVAYDTSLGLSGTGSLNVTAVPEPAPLAFMLASLGLVAIRRMKAL